MTENVFELTRKNLISTLLHFQLPTYILVSALKSEASEMVISFSFCTGHIIQIIFVAPRQFIQMR